MIKYYIFIALFVLLISCKSKQTNVVSSKAAKSLPFVELLSISHSNIKESNFIVIESAKELNTIYSTINMTRRPGYKIPDIDFNTHTVIGLFMGLKNTGGHSVKIDSIVTDNKETIVYCKEISPKDDVVVTTLITHPCFIASIVKTDKPIRFDWVK